MKKSGPELLNAGHIDAIDKDICVFELLTSASRLSNTLGVNSVYSLVDAAYDPTAIKDPLKRGEKSIVNNNPRREKNKNAPPEKTI